MFVFVLLTIIHMHVCVFPHKVSLTALPLPLQVLVEWRLLSSLV